MSSVRGRPFTVGSDFPANKKTEIYKQESDKWETMQDFPFAKINIEQYGIASTHSNGSMYYFSNSSVIPRLNSGIRKRHYVFVWAFFCLKKLEVIQ